MAFTRIITSSPLVRSSRCGIFPFVLAEAQSLIALTDSWLPKTVGLTSAR